MPNEYVSKEELEKERTPSELWDWLIQKVKQICPTQEGLEVFRLQNDKEKLSKKLVEEIAPLAIFGKQKFGTTGQVLLQPVIGFKNCNAKVINNRSELPSVTFVEITQAYLDKRNGKKEYLRRLELLIKGTPTVKTEWKKVLTTNETGSLQQ